MFEIIAIATAAYAALQGVRLLKASGFSFFLTSGLIQSVGVLGVAALLNLEWPDPTLKGKTVVLWLAIWVVSSRLYESWHQNRARRVAPAKWQAWVNTYEQVPLLRRVLLQYHKG